VEYKLQDLGLETESDSFLGGRGGFGSEALKWVFPCKLFNDFHSYPSTYT
jgi:hypothetical protein